MLSTEEMIAAKEKLNVARALIEGVRSVFLCAANIDGARMLNEVTNLLADEIAALDKSIREGKA